MRLTLRGAVPDAAERRGTTTAQNANGRTSRFAIAALAAAIGGILLASGLQQGDAASLHTLAGSLFLVIAAVRCVRALRQ